MMGRQSATLRARVRRVVRFIGVSFYSGTGNAPPGQDTGYYTRMVGPTGCCRDPRKSRMHEVKERMGLRARLCVLLLVPPLVGACEPAASSDPAAFAVDYETYTLENGLDVVLHVDRSDPIAAVAVTYTSARPVSVPARRGFAHLFEHLLFLDSENLGPGGIDMLVDKVGGSMNGSTNRDRTNYYQVVPRDALEKVLWAESDRMGYFINTVTSDVVEKETQVVKNEKRQSYDNRPGGHTYDVIDRNIYPPAHPYHWQVIGSLEDLDTATLADIREFYEAW